MAVDLGAQSCRVSLLRWHGDEAAIEVVHRFANAPVMMDGGLRWNLEAIVAGVIAGLKACAARAPEGIASFGVDGWAVDYVRVDACGKPVAAPYCYRDARTERAESEVHAKLPPSRLYALTGIQILRLNTLYQLYADKLAGFDMHLPWMNLPEYISYRLSGRRVSEYTNATHTGLVALGTHTWCDEVFRELKLDREAAPEIVPSGTVLGAVQAERLGLEGFEETRVIAPACHDTASAIAGIPARGDDWAFISSGTWSLVGTVLDSPCVSAEAREKNFTNLGGVGNRICFLKNVNGMWILQQCMEEWRALGANWPLAELLAQCRSVPAPEALLDIDAPPLMIPGDAIGKINAQLEQQGRRPFARDATSAPAIANTILHSMAARYAEVLSWIGKITGETLRRVYIAGGGSKNELLNRLTEERSGLEVICASPESTTIGNFAVQLAAGERDFKPRKGVTAESAAKWAERLSAVALTANEADEVR
ncbi:MAG TPA: rhamnulokinase family protein [Candidatus Acidoferrum sp.]|nr:rhamnulokinase family protein [Candidatus Acidoferrum sp.]